MTAMMLFASTVITIARIMTLTKTMMTVDAFVYHHSDHTMNVRSPIRIKQTTRMSWKSPFSFIFPASLSSSENSILNEDNDNDQDEEIISSLQNTLSYIEALEQRNTAQIYSFVDEKDQWESLEPYERELLSSKEEILKRLSEYSSVGRLDN
eukprot:CAMPEP_0171023804 /NCGR_PEP_ID=MMETSP0736-20130129/32470_1 /TAXON_ID=186038 /ORGANISM="Fragilariopsis kerguelensis, Strain L26-C5" /LENGTH=151 /DNA_ID=CAMNT_0011463349 /DNA_START=84 /DNA_END=539 /DNA_ORIENTATION=-